MRPSDSIVRDSDGVVAVPQEAARRVVEPIAPYDDKKSRMIPIIQRKKSMLEALGL